MSLLRRLAGAKGFYLAQQIGTPALTFGANVLLARYLTVAEVGVVQSLILVQSWVGWSHLGLINYVSRVLPELSGHDRKGLIALAAWCSLLIGCLVGGTAALLSSWGGLRTDALFAVTVVPWFALSVFENCLESVCRVTGRFLRLVALNWGRLASLAVGVGAVTYWGLNGYLVRFALLTVVVLAVFGWTLDLRPVQNGVLAQIARLWSGVVKTGWGIFFCSILYLLFCSLDRYWVKYSFGETGLGIYTPAYYVWFFAQVVAMTVGSVVYANYILLKDAAFWPFFLKVERSLFVFFVIYGTCGVFAKDLYIALFGAKYVSARDAVFWSFAGTSGMSLGNLGYALQAKGMVLPYGVVMLSALVVFSIGSLMYGSVAGGVLIVLLKGSLSLGAYVLLRTLLYRASVVSHRRSP